MSASTQPPAIPPRPSKSPAYDPKDPPLVPPRPAKRHGDRSVSPNSDRFPRSPLNDSLLKTQSLDQFASSHSTDPIDRPGSVTLPSIGQEGMEYAALREELHTPPEQTRTVGDDVKLMAPKPSLPAKSAKDRVAAVTRTDSDHAAAFGFGKPSDGPNSAPRSLKKKASTVTQLSGGDTQDEDEHGIPEIGQRVPMYPNAGDVQAPSPAPGSDNGLKSRHHSRRTSARGFVELPPGSYGLHGHGIVSQDKLGKAYYEKHPELLQKEQAASRHHNDRPSDFSLSSADLNRIVRETATRGSGLGTSPAFSGTPSEQIGYSAQEEYATRMSRPTSTVPVSGDSDLLKGLVSKSEQTEDAIHVEEQNRKSPTPPIGEQGESEEVPILAPDEVARDPPQYEQQPAVEPPPERSGSAFEIEGPSSRPTSRPSSRPTSRPTSVYNAMLAVVHSTPLEDVEEYEPLFPEDDKDPKAPLQRPSAPVQRFPSKDVWEDAPNSVHFTAEVSTPEPAPKETPEEVGANDKQESPESFLPKINPDASSSSEAISAGDAKDDALRHRFPSRDVWEDAPDSHQLQTTVSGPQQEEEEERSPVEIVKPDIPPRPVKKAIDDEKPVIPERPKTEKPPIPARLVGGKIAALQAGLGLDKRLAMGPQAVKKEEPITQDLSEETSKAPLSDARKGRVRGPQRRAPAKSSTPAVETTKQEGGPLALSFTATVWSIEPEAGVLKVDEKVAAPPEA